MTVVTAMMSGNVQIRITQTRDHRIENAQRTKSYHMTLDFHKFAMKGNEFINHLEQALGNDDRAHAARILRSTFRVLRNHLTFEESLQLLAQLPMVIKAVYVDGWTRGKPRKIKTVDEFLVEIVWDDGGCGWRNFNDREEIIDCVRAVINTMRLYVSAGEMEQALGTLPQKLQEVLEASER